jgi:uncharacterized protein (DUF2126 family)/transglutaminase-like putative cysteine protease
MSIHVALRHVTRYCYDRPVSLGPQIVRLKPAPHCRTPVLSYSLKVTPAKHFVNWQQDPQSNYQARLVFPEKTREFCVEVDLVAEMAVFNPFDYFLEPQAETFPFRYDPVLAHELEPYQRKLPLTSRVGDYMRGLKARLRLGQAEGTRTTDMLVGINQALWEDIKYLVRMEPGVQTPDETLERGSGSCRDSAWLMCQILRQLGLAARFVSGYLIQLTPDVKSLDGPSGTEVDFTDLHAWCEVYLPGAGWVGLDPTSGLFAGEGHLPLAATPDPQSAAPISGGVDECKVEFDFSMKVTRIHESARVTKPYTEEHWDEITRLGERIDDELADGDVRLTMGGEPTFVSIDDMDGEEWNNAAMGPTKRLLSGELLLRLKRKFSPGGLRFYGQGKWYPGEQLPRWALACYWRKDGVPIWQDDDLIADERVDLGHKAEDAQLFGLTLAAALGVEPKWLQAGYEDAFYYLWKERRLPTNVDPFESNLKDPLERKRLAKVFEQGLDAVVGYALPLKRVWLGDGLMWQSGPWFMRDERMYLVPGDSAMGYRLPLDSLPWVSEKDFPWIHPPDPQRKYSALTTGVAVSGRAQALQAVATWFKQQPEARRLVADLPEGLFAGQGKPLPKGPRPTASATRPPGHGESAAWLTRTALCIEAREGRVHIFMPPVESMEDFLDLVSAIEDTARALEMPVILEGTAPPYDPRVNVFRITPDPGVIEVNLQPAHSWKELAFNTTTLYEEARLSRLGTEKFMVDGRHTGTGGGNHIVMGGSTPADSPLLRRPDLLRSLLGYWHNHPSLSYLFSGLFIGPTSQHPRIDEARHDQLYELDLAFKQVPDHAQVPAWLVDRLFRNIVIDATGNTHRTEFCIDKLFSPDSSTGRLGLVELRSFEMPPHSRMSLAQHLLLRAAIARFWNEPYSCPLVRWGTQLHDRFMLPHFVWDDFVDVLEDMTAAGYPIQPEWFAPHFEFRFPHIGSMTQRNIHLEIRHALEPWHVLGEEGSPGGTVRLVDSSLERLQVKTEGLVEGRYVVTCNGVTIPLHPTGTQGSFVAGVRYRAWQPAHCLQPTIGVHAPLVFDIVDTWNERSLGGCTYHVAHPGGRSYETFPINAYEAESRRLGRFSAEGHNQGRMVPGPAKRSADFPMTLDLRNARDS